MFEAIQVRESAVEACARAIRGAVLRGELEAGERLPPERELAETLGVTRLTLRSALAQLTAAGLLAARQGSGTYVTDYQRRCGPDLLPGIADLARERGELPAAAADLLLVRRQLARAVLERLPSRVPKAELQAIEAAVAAFADAAASGAGAALAQADLEVLTAVVDATGSAVLRLCLNPVARVLSSLPELREAIYARPADNVAGWQGLLAWLRSSDRAGLDLIIAEMEKRDRSTVARMKRRAS
jgi:GntR family transcriptional regulator, transcriptional repressor for pyruvate dehydrogenase complex